MGTIEPNNIDKLKVKLLVTYSEQIFGIPAAPDYQCSKIDEIVRTINAIQKKMKRHERFDEDELRSAMSDIEYDLSGIDRDIEDIRTAIEGVREWGQNWKEVAKRMMNEHHSVMDDFIKGLVYDNKEWSA